MSFMKTLCVYFLFAVFRVINAALIQSQFDPDEYWQNLEPAYCYVFAEADATCQGLTWEWRSQPTTIITSIINLLSLINALRLGLHGPVRSFSSIVPTMIFYKFIKEFGWDSSWMVARGPVYFNAILVAATTDLLVWYMSRWMELTSLADEGGISIKKPLLGINFCVYCCLSSWFNAYALVRTYSNSLETLIVTLSVALVSPELLAEQKGKRSTIREIIRACLSFLLGGICTAIRFTCLTIYIPMGILLACRRSSTLFRLSYLLGVCAVFGALGLLLTILLDRCMYGYWAFPLLGNLYFNVIQGNGSLYGSHPFYWYLIVGIPALTGMMMPLLIYDSISSRGWSDKRGNLWILIGSCVVAHSGSAHKEFRFLLPILPMFCLLSGPSLSKIVAKIRPRSRYLVLATGLLLNFGAVLYLGLLHQRAPIDVNRAILMAVAAENHRFQEGPVRVHYLMGCHSTPLLSHLHSPSAKFDTWYLDCSPSCRMDTSIDCESDAFAKHPRVFLDQAYNIGCNADDGETCAAMSNRKSQTIPDFVVISSEDLSVIAPLLDTPLNMQEIGRFIQRIRGIRFGIDGSVDGGYAIDCWYICATIIFEEMILYERRETVVRDWAEQHLGLESTIN